MLNGTAQALARIRRSLTILEQRLDIVIKALGISLSEEFNPKILVDEAKVLARTNRKIEAIVIHRSLTGAGLAVAKQALDEYLLQCKK